MSDGARLGKFAGAFAVACGPVSSLAAEIGIVTSINGNVFCQQTTRFGKVLRVVRSPGDIKMCRSNFGVPGKEIDRGAIEVAGIHIILGAFGELAQLDIGAHRPLTARQRSTQIISRAACLRPLLRASIGQSEVEHCFGARFGRSGNGIQSRRRFGEAPRIGRRNRPVRLRCRGRRRRETRKCICVSVVSFTEALRGKKLLRARERLALMSRR